MRCRYCQKPIQHTFASLVLRREVHKGCEDTLINPENVIAYPFLEGIIMVDYLVDKLPEKADIAYLEQRYFSKIIARIIEEDCVTLLLVDEVTSEDLYLLFLLANQRLSWVFMERPGFLL